MRMNYIAAESKLYEELWRHALEIHPKINVEKASNEDKALWFDAMFDKMNKFWNFEQEVDRAVNHLIKTIQDSKDE